MRASGRAPGGRRRSSKNEIVTKSGNVFKVHRNLTEKWVARKDAVERRRAERKATLPKDRVKRFLYHFQPKRMYRYWFSRDGGIMALKIVGTGFVVGFVVLIGIFAYFRKDLPNLKDISGGNIGGSIRYYDRTCKTSLWEDYDAVKRIPVNTGDINNYVRQATVAVEDKDFFKHGGFDVRGILRAGVNDAFGHGGTQGGSTITQQVVKLNQDWTKDRTLSRKIKEVILAVELERNYSKQDILTGYLNTAPYGNVEYGVEAASRDYFQKSAKDLTLDESAFLAAIPKSPAIYSPYGPYYDKKALIDRQQYILDIMVQQNMISRAQADAAKKVNILKKIHKQQPKYAGIKAPYFVLAAKRQLESDYTEAVKRGGWKVCTTLDLKLQNIAEKVVQSNRPNAQAHGADEEALVAEDVKTGEMVALVGGTDFNNADHGKINYAQWNIAPGSSFKPYDYSTLIENSTNAGAGSVLYDTVGKLPGYACTNHGPPPPRGQGNCLTDYDFRQPGPLSLRYALGGSRNIPAVKAMLTIGTDKTIQTADAMMAVPGAYKCYNPGANVNTATSADEAQCYGASAIGDGAYLHLDNHVNGLATLARLGSAISQTYILSITEANGKPVQLKKRETQQVLRPDTAYIVDNMASDPNASYLPFGYYKWHRYNGWNTAIKTGTTNNGFDGLMMAWNTQYAVGSWVGYHTRNQSLLGAMEYSTTPLARGFMTQALDSLHKSPVAWNKPSGVKTAPAFVVRSHVGIGSVEPSPSTDLYPSWYVPNSRQSTSNKPIDIVSNRLATDCTPSLAKKSATNSNANIFSIDIFVAGGAAGTNTTATDNVHHCDDERPQISISSTTSPCTVGSTCSVTVDFSAGTHPLNSSRFPGTINIKIDGRTLKTITVSSGGTKTINFTYSGSSGSHSLTAQIIDSVLYDTTDSTNVNFTGASSPVTSVTAKKTGSNTVTITWSGGVGPFTVSDNVTGHTKSCSDSSSCSMTLANAPLGSSITVIDSNSSSASGTVTL